MTQHTLSKWAAEESHRVAPNVPLHIMLSQPGNPAIVVAPEDGATVSVEYSLAPRADIEANTGHFFAWPPGDVTQPEVYAFELPVRAIRVTAVGAGAKVDVLQA